MRFESLKQQKFEALTREEMLHTRGGEDTGAGKEVIGTWNLNLPCEGQSGGVNYVHEDKTFIRTWTSDCIVDGKACYTNEGYGWVDPPGK